MIQNHSWDGKAGDMNDKSIFRRLINEIKIDTAALGPWKINPEDGMFARIGSRCFLTFMYTSMLIIIGSWVGIAIAIAIPVYHSITDPEFDIRTYRQSQPTPQPLPTAIPMSLLVIDPPAATLVPGQIMRFTVLAFDRFEQSTSITGAPVFSTTEAAGLMIDRGRVPTAFGHSGIFTAGQYPGDYKQAIKVTIETDYGQLIATADIAIVAR